MTENIIFVHGLESSGEGFKGQLFRKEIPGILTPSFKVFTQGISIEALLKDRMAELTMILESGFNWTIIGSSFGGLMSVIYTCQNPSKVRKLILLAPYLNSSELEPLELQNIPLDIPVIVYHSEKDMVVPLKPVREKAEQFFSNLEYNVVDDDHRLQKTVKSLNWKGLIK